MEYQQTLFKIIKDVVNSKILKKNNRFKKWEYGYNKENDIVKVDLGMETYLMETTI